MAVNKTLRVTFVMVYNGTFPLNDKNDHVRQIAEIFCLALLYLLIFAFNLFLLISIVSSRTVRKIPFNLLLANFSMNFLLECLMNMSIALYYAINHVWKLGETACSINAFGVQLVIIEVTLNLCLMCVEVMGCIWQPYRFQTFLSVKKQIVAIATMWMIGILVCLPLLAKSIPSHAFPSRYSCTLAGHDSFGYGIFLTVWCYALFIIVGAGSLIKIGIRRYKDHRVQKKRRRDYSSVFLQGDLWVEWVNVKVVTLLFGIYIVMELPYILINLITPLQALDDQRETVGNVTLIDLPLVDRTPIYEAVFTWFRYGYAAVFPLLIFRMRKDVRRKFRSLFNCCHKNTTRDDSAVLVANRRAKESKESSKNKNKNPLDLNTPILYVSPGGLCVRQFQSSPCSGFRFQGGRPTKGHFTSYLCDVDPTEESESRIDSSTRTTIRNASSSEESIYVDVLIPVKRPAKSLLPERPPPQVVATIDTDFDSATDVEPPFMEVELPYLPSGSSISPRIQLVEETSFIDTIPDSANATAAVEAPSVSEENAAESSPRKKMVRFSNAVDVFPIPNPKPFESLKKTAKLQISFPRMAFSRIPILVKDRKSALPWVVVNQTSTFRVEAPTVTRKTIPSIVGSESHKTHVDDNDQVKPKKQKTLNLERFPK